MWFVAKIGTPDFLQPLKLVWMKQFERSMQSLAITRFLVGFRT